MVLFAVEAVVVSAALAKYKVPLTFLRFVGQVFVHLFLKLREYLILEVFSLRQFCRGRFRRLSRVLQDMLIERIELLMFEENVATLRSRTLFDLVSVQVQERLLLLLKEPPDVFLR